MSDRFLTLWKSWVLVIQGRPYLLASLSLLCSGVVAGTLSFVSGIDKRVATLCRVLAFVFSILGAIFSIWGEIRNSQETSNDVERQQKDRVRNGAFELEEPGLPGELSVKTSHVADTSTQTGDSSARVDITTTSGSSHGSSHLTKVHDSEPFLPSTDVVTSTDLSRGIFGRVIWYPDRPLSVDLSQSAADPCEPDPLNAANANQNNYTAMVDSFNIDECEARDIPISEESPGPSSRGANLVPKLGSLPSNARMSFNNYGPGTMNVHISRSTIMLHQARSHAPIGGNAKLERSHKF
ncbi:hypothetical protein V5O48_017595 [Marasmius crinis-equi]|uniref:Transmembrane protein n=1 Tax=Marasmius crinis-equi TaxID=585013 RepID=A0ABR3ENJ2_9AGAR